MARARQWHLKRYESGGYGWERSSGPLHGRIVKNNDRTYVYTVSEKPMREDSFFQRRTVSSLASAKSAVTKILSKYHGGGTKACIHCGAPVPEARVASVCNKCLAKYRRGQRSK